MTQAVRRTIFPSIRRQLHFGEVKIVLERCTQQWRVAMADHSSGSTGYVARKHTTLARRREPPLCESRDWSHDFTRPTLWSVNPALDIEARYVACRALYRIPVVVCCDPARLPLLTPPHPGAPGPVAGRALLLLETAPRRLVFVRPALEPAACPRATAVDPDLLSHRRRCGLAGRPADSP